MIFVPLSLHDALPIYPLRERRRLQVRCRDDRDDRVVTGDPGEVVGDQPIPTYHLEAWMGDRDGLGAPCERRNTMTTLQRLLNHKPPGATAGPDNEQSHSAPLSPRIVQTAL